MLPVSSEGYSMSTQVTDLKAILVPGESLPATEWRLLAIRSEQCMSYIAWNERTREAILIDPKMEDQASYQKIHIELENYLWLAVIDTHTHADHVSIAALMAQDFKAPLVMHVLSPSARVHLRVSKETFLPAHAAAVQLIPTPGHTQDAITVIWGPFLFGGDTLLYGDTGRDDLPGGDPEAHYASIQKIKELARPEMIVLPGHDSKGARASSWSTQLRENPSLIQDRESFVREASAFEAPAPKSLKKSLHENFK